MGFPPMKAREFRDYVRTVKGLLRGETVEHREGDIARQIRLLHPDKGIVNLDGPIPVYVAAFGRQVIRMAAELGDGFISFGGTPDDIRAARVVLAEGAQRARRDLAAGGLPHYRFPDRLCPLSRRAGRFDCGPHGRRPGNLRLAALFHSRRGGGQ
jgi:alkanesulfonate monooxygenase SsuD/methylene tetrahydromethanopterin reductase-like flavin-dependent oxidoreductase (luciferase family)